LWKGAEEAIKRDDLPAAESFLRKCVTVMPLLLQARYTLGFVLARQRRFKEAEEEIRKAIEFEPKRSDGYINLGVFFGMFFSDRCDDAIAAFRQAIALDPGIKNYLDTADSLSELRKKPWFSTI
jgi:Flp pilus assembly protein TadD